MNNCLLIAVKSFLQVCLWLLVLFHLFYNVSYKLSFNFPLIQIQLTCLILCHFCLTTKKILQCILISMDKLFFHWTWAVCLLFLVFMLVQFSSVQFSCSVVSDSLRPHETQHVRPPCPSPTIESEMPSNHLILCHPLPLLPSIFPSIRVFSNESALQITWPKYWSSVSTSVFPMNTQDWSLGWTGWITLQSKGLSRVCSKCCC